MSEAVGQMSSATPRDAGRVDASAAVTQRLTSQARELKRAAARGRLQTA